MLLRSGQTAFINGSNRCRILAAEKGNEQQDKVREGESFAWETMKLDYKSEVNK